MNGTKCFINWNWPKRSEDLEGIRHSHQLNKSLDETLRQLEEQFPDISVIQTGHGTSTPQKDRRRGLGLEEEEEEELGTSMSDKTVIDVETLEKDVEEEEAMTWPMSINVSDEGLYMYNFFGGAFNEY